MDQFFDMAAGLAMEGEKVILYLVCDGVTPLRGGPYRDRVKAMSDMGVIILADNESMENRGMNRGDLPPGIEEGTPQIVAQYLLQGCKAVWHGIR